MLVVLQDEAEKSHAREHYAGSTQEASNPRGSRMGESRTRSRGRKTRAESKEALLAPIQEREAASNF